MCTMHMPLARTPPLSKFHPELLRAPNSSITPKNDLLYLLLRLETFANDPVDSPPSHLYTLPQGGGKNLENPMRNGTSSLRLPPRRETEEDRVRGRGGRGELDG